MDNVHCSGYEIKNVYIFNFYCTLVIFKFLFFCTAYCSVTFRYDRTILILVATGNPLTPQIGSSIRLTEEYYVKFA